MGFCNPAADILAVRSVLLAHENLEAFEEGSFASGAGAGERVEDQATGRGDQANEIAHEGERLHRRVLGTVALGS
jgi:hypothetical protein